jgi:hypothetical protein
MTENISSFFADFGVNATIGAATVRGIFDAAFAESLGFVGGTTPQLLCASADVTSVVEGTAVTIAAVSYTVAEIHPDGTGITLLRLETA